MRTKIVFLSLLTGILLSSCINSRLAYLEVPNETPIVPPEAGFKYLIVNNDLGSLGYKYINSFLYSMNKKNIGFKYKIIESGRQINQGLVRKYAEKYQPDIILALNHVYIYPRNTFFSEQGGNQHHPGYPAEYYLNPVFIARWKIYVPSTNSFETIKVPYQMFGEYKAQDYDYYNKIAEKTGDRTASLFISDKITADRHILVPENKDFENAYDEFLFGTPDSAKVVWESYTSHKNDILVAASYHNLAIYAENKGDVEKAKELAGKALDEFKNKTTAKYLEALEK